MARFFICLLVLLILLTGLTSEILAMGVTDFVAVSDGASSALYNPAGLVELDRNIFKFEHRLDGRYQFAMDDMVIYAAKDEIGTGALFWAYDQTLAGYSEDRVNDFGYALGWPASEKIMIGTVLKYSTSDRYSNFSGTWELKPGFSRDSFSLDVGLLIKPAEHWRMGIAFHNLGKDDSFAINYQSTIGLAFQSKRLIFAFEVYDFLNEGGVAFEGLLYRAGCRLSIIPNFRIHLVGEMNETYQGELFGLEYDLKNISIGTSWYQADGDFFNNDSTLQLSIGYRF